MAVEKVLENNPVWVKFDFKKNFNEAKVFRTTVYGCLLNMNPMEDIQNQYGALGSIEFTRKVHQTLPKCRTIVDPQLAETLRRRKDPNAIVAKGDGHATRAQDREWVDKNQKDPDPEKIRQS